MIKDPVEEESLVIDSKDPLIAFLKRGVLVAVKVLAVMMGIVIWVALADVVVHLYQIVQKNSILTLFDVDSLLNTLGDFLAVLIAIEVFLNIIFYLRKDSIHVPLVLATALTAAARKVIVLDFIHIGPGHVFALASIVFALGLSYWLIARKPTTE